MIRTRRWFELRGAEAECRMAAVAPAGRRSLRWDQSRGVDGIDVSTHRAGWATAPQGQVAFP